MGFVGAQFATGTSHVLMSGLAQTSPTDGSTPTSEGWSRIYTSPWAGPGVALCAGATAAVSVSATDPSTATRPRSFLNFMCSRCNAALAKTLRRSCRPTKIDKRGSVVWGGGMEFRLLGDIEVRVGDRSLDVGTPRQQTVLAALAVDAGRPVAMDTLIDRVWDDAPPAEARNALYSHLSRIRR